MSLTIKMYDLETNELADISGIALERSLQRVLNGARKFTVGSFANDALFTAIAGDGYRNLRRGNRKLIVWESGITAPIFHGRIFGVERNAQGGKMTPVTITALDASMELGYESDDRAGRVVRGASRIGGTYDGNFIDPKFVSSVDGGNAISGPDLIKQALENSMNTGSESDPSPGEGPLPIDLTTGDFDLDVPPAVDMNGINQQMSWPVMIGDYIQEFVKTGVVDVDWRPVDPAEGLDPYVMVALSAVSSFGTDRHATVHFDYGTGAFNAAACRHIEDFSTINNKLYDYLGPRGTYDDRHWKGNITPGSPGTTVDPSASRALYGGEFMQIRDWDSTEIENSSRPLYLARWNAEQGYRVEPRDLLYITPAKGAKALFEALKDFDVGDLVKVNTGPDLGVELAETQRVYGFTKQWDHQGIATVSELLTSADA